MIIIIGFLSITYYDFFVAKPPVSTIAVESQMEVTSPDDERMLRAPKEGEGHPLFNRAEEDRTTHREPGIINKLLEHFSIATTLVILIIGGTILFMGPFVGYLFYLRKKYPEKYS